MTKRTALTGFIVPKCKVYGNGFFSEESLDPDNLKDELNSLRKRFKDKTIDARKAEIQKIKDNGDAYVQMAHNSLQLYENKRV